MARPSPHLKKRPRLRGMKRKPNVTEGTASAAFPTFTSCLSCSCSCFCLFFSTLCLTQWTFWSMNVCFHLVWRQDFFVGFFWMAGSAGHQVGHTSLKCTKYNPPPPTLPPSCQREWEGKSGGYTSCWTPSVPIKWRLFSLVTPAIWTVTVTLCDWFAHRY